MYYRIETISKCRHWEPVFNVEGGKEKYGIGKYEKEHCVDICTGMNS